MLDAHRSNTASRQQHFSCFVAKHALLRRGGGLLVKPGSPAQRCVQHARRLCVRTFAKRAVTEATQSVPTQSSLNIPEWRMDPATRYAVGVGVLTLTFLAAAWTAIQKLQRWRRSRRVAADQMLIATAERKWERRVMASAAQVARLKVSLMEKDSALRQMTIARDAAHRQVMELESIIAAKDEQLQLLLQEKQTTQHATQQQALDQLREEKDAAQQRMTAIEQMLAEKKAYLEQVLSDNASVSQEDEELQALKSELQSSIDNLTLSSDLPTEPIRGGVTSSMQTSFGAHDDTDMELGSSGTATAVMAPPAQRQRTGVITLAAGAAMLPHPEKAATGGEDAYFVYEGGCGAIGVADGVSGWADEGVDSSLYSRRLMKRCEEAVRDADVSGSGTDVMTVLKHAHDNTNEMGSSTACIAVMSGQHLKIANLGDSGVTILRSGKAVFHTALQEHMFNMPYQLSHVREAWADTPDKADVYDVAVEEGDVVVMATDGLFDNMYDDQLADLVQSNTPEASEQTPAAAQRLANLLATTARRNAQDASFVSPWASAALSAELVPESMGKLDDCTVVVAFVKRNSV